MGKSRPQRYKNTRLGSLLLDSLFSSTSARPPSSLALGVLLADRRCRAAVPQRLYLPSNMCYASFVTYNGCGCRIPIDA